MAAELKDDILWKKIGNTDVPLDIRGVLDSQYAEGPRDSETREKSVITFRDHYGWNEAQIAEAFETAIAQVPEELRALELASEKAIATDALLKKYKDKKPKVAASKQKEMDQAAHDIAYAEWMSARDNARAKLEKAFEEQEYGKVTLNDTGTGSELFTSAIVGSLLDTKKFEHGVKSAPRGLEDQEPSTIRAHLNGIVTLSLGGTKDAPRDMVLDVRDVLALSEEGKLEGVQYNAEPGKFVAALSVAIPDVGDRQWNKLHKATVAMVEAQKTIKDCQDASGDVTSDMTQRAHDAMGEWEKAKSPITQKLGAKFAERGYGDLKRNTISKVLAIVPSKAMLDVERVKYGLDKPGKGEEIEAALAAETAEQVEAEPVSAGEEHDKGKGANELDLAEKQPVPELKDGIFTIQVGKKEVQVDTKAIIEAFDGQVTGEEIAVALQAALPGVYHNIMDELDNSTQEYATLLAETMKPGFEQRDDAEAVRENCFDTNEYRWRQKELVESHLDKSMRKKGIGNYEGNDDLYFELRDLIVDHVALSLLNVHRAEHGMEVSNDVDKPDENREHKVGSSIEQASRPDLSIVFAYDLARNEAKYPKSGRDSFSAVKVAYRAAIEQERPLYVGAVNAGWGLSKLTISPLAPPATQPHCRCEPDGTITEFGGKVLRDMTAEARDKLPDVEKLPDAKIGRVPLPEKEAEVAHEDDEEERKGPHAASSEVVEVDGDRDKLAASAGREWDGKGEQRGFEF